MCTPTAPPSNLQLLSSSKNLGRIPLSPRLALWGLKRTRPSTQLRQLLRSRARCASSSRTRGRRTRSTTSTRWTSHDDERVESPDSALRLRSWLSSLRSPRPPRPGCALRGVLSGTPRYCGMTYVHIYGIYRTPYTRTLSSFTQPMPHTCTRRCCVSLLLAEKTCVEPVLARVVQVLVKIDHVVLHTCACTRLARVSAS